MIFLTQNFMSLVMLLSCHMSFHMFLGVFLVAILNSYFEIV